MSPIWRQGLLIGTLVAIAAPAQSQARQLIVIRGHQQVLYTYGPPGGDPILVSSGDGGWIHLGPGVARLLADRGAFVVGFDAKAYLSSFTSPTSCLRPEDVPGDYGLLVDAAAGATHRKPVLIGVSEGAGLSVLAATDPRIKTAVAGVIGLGLGDLNELGWRWRDSLIYLTHGVPAEPTFSVAGMVDRVAPLPLAAIHATRDEYVPVAEVRAIFQAAREPKQLWIVDAANHRFSDNPAELARRLLEAVDWVRRNTPP